MNLNLIPKSSMLKILNLINSNNCLIGCGKVLSSINLDSLYFQLTLEDDQNLIQQLEEELTTTTTSRINSKFSNIWNNQSYSNRVTSLFIVKSKGTSLYNHYSHNSGFERRNSKSSTTQFNLEEEEVEGVLEEENDSTTSTIPLNDSSLATLLLKLPNLQVIHWETDRLPPEELCKTLNNSTKSLTSFVLNFNKFEFDSTNNSSSSTGLSKPLRYDATHISSLPISLTHLSLSSLSHEGSLNLSNSFTSLPLLEELEIYKTVHIDDQFMEGLADGARKLKKLKIYEMSGTKLTEKGLAIVFEELTDLTELWLGSLDGRLSKKCWTSLSPLPSSLTSLIITYSETGPYKSWTFDHLTSLPDLISSSPSLTTLSISREVPLEALKDINPLHSTSVFPICDALSPKPIPIEIFNELIEPSRVSGWNDLRLDFWELSLDQLKKLLEKGSELRRLKIRLDSPFRSLLTLSSAFALSHHLQQFEISINPRHITILSEPSTSFNQTGSLGIGGTTNHQHFSPPVSPLNSPNSKFTTSLPTLSSSPNNNTISISPPNSFTSRSPISNSSYIITSINPTGQTSTLEIPSPVPSLREWRRFLKKSLKLTCINWSGRGGYGVWKFDRNYSSSSSSTGGITNGTNSNSTAGIGHSSSIGIEFFPSLGNGDSERLQEVEEDCSFIGAGGKERRGSVSSIGSASGSSFVSKRKGRRMSEVSVNKVDEEQQLGTGLVEPLSSSAMANGNGGSIGVIGDKRNSNSTSSISTATPSSNSNYWNPSSFSPIVSQPILATPTTAPTRVSPRMAKMQLQREKEKEKERLASMNSTTSSKLDFPDLVNSISNNSTSSTLSSNCNSNSGSEVKKTSGSGSTGKKGKSWKK